jgi:methylated-DNA-[protein]-cysteine S-methyltransferase
LFPSQHVGQAFEPDGNGFVRRKGPTLALALDAVYSKYRMKAFGMSKRGKMAKFAHSPDPDHSYHWTITTMQTIAFRSARPRHRIARGHVEILDVTAIVFKTELNWTAFAIQRDALLGIVFGHATRAQAEAALRRAVNSPSRSFDILGESEIGGLPDVIGDLADRLRRYAAGEPVDFSDVRIADSHLTPFGKRIVAACRRIGWGGRRSYGELAAECGSAGAARAVGQVMAKNRFPLVVPCHRVLGAGGSLGGFSAPEGLRMKRRLLAMESDPV